LDGTHPKSFLRVGKERNDEEDKKQEGRNIMAYCTGGIRCEKATRWILENARMRPGDEVYTL
jgi:predicted sulfurtransferase